MIRAVLFDLDGTLVDTNRLIIESFKYTYKKHLNLEIGEEEICKYFGEPLITTLRRYDDKNADELCATYRSYNEKKHDEMAAAFEGALEVTIKLKQSGIKVGVVTSKRKEMAERGLRLAGVLDIMDIIITPEDTQNHKPSPEPLLKACEVLGLSSAEVLYVGDTHFDILCSKNAGCKSCLVKYTALSVDELLLHNPDYAVEMLMDIIDIVDNENSDTVTI